MPPSNLKIPFKNENENCLGTEGRHQLWIHALLCYLSPGGRRMYVRTCVRAIMSHKVIASGFRQKCHRHRWKTTSQTSRFWVASKNTIVFQPLFLFTIITLYHLLILHHSKRRFGLISFFFFAHRWSLWMSGPFYGMKSCLWMLWWCNDLSTERRITLFKTPTLV